MRYTLSLIAFSATLLSCAHASSPCSKDVCPAPAQSAPAPKPADCREPDPTYTPDGPPLIGCEAGEVEGEMRCGYVFVFHMPDKYDYQCLLITYRPACHALFVPERIVCSPVIEEPVEASSL